MDKADRHTDAACADNEAKPREPLPQMISNRHGPTSCRLSSIGSSALCQYLLRPYSGCGPERTITSVR